MRMAGGRIQNYDMDGGTKAVRDGVYGRDVHHSTLDKGIAPSQRKFDVIFLWKWRDFGHVSLHTWGGGQSPLFPPSYTPANDILR